MNQAIKINPTTIITGFLGAGKTTYLNSLLEVNQSKKYAIIENEFGKKSIDSEIIIRGEENVIELNNGCLCCTINDGLYDILNELYHKRHDFDELIIEATGLADPRGLAAPFITNPPIKKQYPLQKVICLIDAALIEEQLENTEEAIHQITYSDVLLINKTDLVDKRQLASLEAKLTQLNPLAQIVYTNEQNMDQAHDQFSQNSMQLDADDEPDLGDFKVKQLETHNHKHTEGIKSIYLSFDEPFDLQKLRMRLHVFLMFQAGNLYRMKGTLCLNDSDEKFLLQSVGKGMSIDPIRKWKPGEKRTSTIVLIGKNLERYSLMKMFSHGQ